MTSSFRVTERSLAATAINGLQHNLSRLGDLQQELSSGKLLSKASDSPTATVQAMQYRAQIQAQQQYSRNASDGLGWLSTLDTALTGSLSQIQRARDLTVQGMSTGGATSAQSASAYAAEIDSIRDSLLTTANTTYLGRPVFGGTTAGSTAFDAYGTYVGDTGAVNRTVGDGVRIRVDASGPAVFGTGNTQLFKVLTDISSDLRANPSALSDDLTRLDTAMTTLQSQVSDIGARYNRVSQMKQVADTSTDSLKTQLSDVEDIDLPKTITDLQLQQTAYQAALSATSKVIQPSLLDYLK